MTLPHNGDHSLVCLCKRWLKTCLVPGPALDTGKTCRGLAGETVIQQMVSRINAMVV